jgi:hypothetical protein
MRATHIAAQPTENNDKHHTQHLTEAKQMHGRWSLRMLMEGLPVIIAR